MRASYAAVVVNHTAMPINCDAAMSDAVLQAARAAMPTDPAACFADPTVIRRLGPKNDGLVPLLMALLDSAQATARAIADNAWDDSLPVDRQLAEELSTQAYRLGAEIVNSAQCPDARTWSLPSMSGKELV